jgi:hypothetical protein
MIKFMIIGVIAIVLFMVVKWGVILYKAFHGLRKLEESR